MKAAYHRRITLQALENKISNHALKIIIRANCAQDALRYQIGHDHFHYDSNAFRAGDAYVEQMHEMIVESLAQRQIIPAWQAFGRLLHAVQDFYAHSNYVELWRERQPDAGSEHIPPLLADLMHDPRLHSGRLYYPLEVLSFLPLLQPLVLPMLPRDSHTWMNKDDPSRPNFDFAFAAAVKRTALEFDKIAQAVSAADLTLFTNLHPIS